MEDQSPSRTSPKSIKTRGRRWSVKRVTMKNTYTIASNSRKSAPMPAATHGTKQAAFAKAVNAAAPNSFSVRHDEDRVQGQ
jgi:hypothetical protein